MQKHTTGQFHILQRVLLDDEALVCGQQTIDIVFRNLIEPVLQCKDESVVFVKVKHSQSYENLLKRINFVNPNIFSFDSEMSFLKEQKVNNSHWDDIQFLIVISNRYSGALVWSEKLSTEVGNESGTALTYSIINSKNVMDIARNISADYEGVFDEILNKYNPERRSNDVMNSVYSGMIKNLNTLNRDFSLTLAEKNILNPEKFSFYEKIYNKTSAICHEIRNHLSVIDMYATILEKKSALFKETELKKSCENYITTTKKSLFSVSFLLNSLKNDETNIQKINLSEIVSNVVQMTLPKIEYKNIEIKSDVNKEINVLADEIKFQNVLLNLVYNAIDALNENTGTIELNLSVDEKTARLTIKDNGSGVCETIKKQLFTAGYTTKPTGNGLGLSICKENMLQMNGDINLVCSDESGTEFELSLPICVND